MKKLFFILLVLASCTKETAELHKVQLTVEGNGSYTITYGTNNQVTIKGEDKWSTILSARPGDTIHLSVRTVETPATLYLGVELQEGLLFYKSLFIEPLSTGSLNYILEP